MMKIYNLYYNEETKKIDVQNFIVKDEFDFSYASKLNFQDGPIGHFVSEEDARTLANGYNEDIASGKLILKRCKECNKYFVLKDSEVEWYSASGLAIPKRCSKCRAERKKANKEGN